MTPETREFLARLKPTKTVWCQQGRTNGLPWDEHQVCLDREAAHYARGFTTWSCTCSCHR